MKNEDEFDRIMSEEEILPSSGFAASVMDAVRREAATPPPIPFPWKRALPGAIFAASTLITILTICAIKLFDTSAVTPGQPISVSPSQLLLQAHAQWVLLGLVAVLTVWKMPSFLGLNRS